jgi:putative thioredoxin
MGQSIVVTQAEFEPAVLAQSFKHPVLVDFFATWCGPCQMLKPMLEKLVSEYDFTLAKVDIDQNPELAKTYGVEGVPDVRIVVQGQVQEGFVGVLPEPQLRELLGKLGLQSALDKDLAVFEAAQADQDPQAVQAALTTLLIQYPENAQVLLLAAQTYLRLGQADVANQYLGLISPADSGVASQVEGLKGLIEFQGAIASLSPTTPADQTFLAGCQAALDGDHGTALEQFLALVKRDRQYRKDGARKAMLTLFKVLGDAHPLTISYRKQLMQALY